MYVEVQMIVFNTIFVNCVQMILAPRGSGLGAFSLASALLRSAPLSLLDTFNSHMEYSVEICVVILIFRFIKYDNRKQLRTYVIY